MAVRAAGAVDAATSRCTARWPPGTKATPRAISSQETRKLLGERVPIVVSFDLHGILTDRMLEHADGSVVYHTYPHVDFFETGRRAARLLLRILDEGLRPATALVKIPALVRGNELITETGIFGGLIRQCEADRGQPRRPLRRHVHRQPVHRRARSPLQQRRRHDGPGPLGAGGAAAGARVLGRARA